MMTESQEQGQGQGYEDVEVLLSVSLARQYSGPMTVEPGRENVIILRPSYRAGEVNENGDHVMSLEVTASVAGLVSAGDADYLSGVVNLLRGFCEDLEQAATLQREEEEQTERQAEGEGDAQPDRSS